MEGITTWLLFACLFFMILYPITIAVDVYCSMNNLTHITLFKSLIFTKHGYGIPLQVFAMGGFAISFLLLCASCTCKAFWYLSHN